MEILKKCVKFNIGNGEGIHVYQDNWLPYSPPRPAHGYALNSILRVCDLINHSGMLRSLNDESLSQYLTEEDKKAAKSILLAQLKEPDKLYWSYTIDGNYSVHSGYHLATNINGNLTPPPHGDPTLKLEIWYPWDSYRHDMSTLLLSR